jgi:hypothetical protein
MLYLDAILSDSPPRNVLAKEHLKLNIVWFTSARFHDSPFQVLMIEFRTMKAGASSGVLACGPTSC